MAWNCLVAIDDGMKEALVLKDVRSGLRYLDAILERVAGLLGGAAVGFIYRVLVQDVTGETVSKDLPPFAREVPRL